MKILNVMLGKGRGGLEQAAIDYHEALHMAGHTVTTIIHPAAAIRTALDEQDLLYQPLKPLGEWDFLASRKLRSIAQSLEADLIIGHGNRAIGLALRALKGRIPVVGVAHNYNIQKRFPKCDVIFCITKDLMEDMVHLDISRHRLCHIPNLVRIPERTPRTSINQPPVIGTLGRFVKKKGFDNFLQTIKALKEQNVIVEAKIAGDGPQALELEQMAKQFGIEDHVTFCGWVDDKTTFFRSLDLFVLPSYHEPFGIVLIEAMAHGLPCITTDTEGPCEIITHEHDALMVDKAQPYQMARAIIDLLDEPDRLNAMGEAAYLKATSRYDIAVISERLDEAVQKAAAL